MYTPSSLTLPMKEIDRLLAALRSNEEESIKKIFKIYPDVLKAEDTWKQTVLHLAAKEGNVSEQVLMVEDTVTVFHDRSTLLRSL